ncbi:MAG TPA: hypothetical protein VGN37_08245 [Actinocatenispora sp.]
MARALAGDDDQKAAGTGEGGGTGKPDHRGLCVISDHCAPIDHQRGSANRIDPIHSRQAPLKQVGRRGAGAGAEQRDRPLHGHNVPSCLLRDGQVNLPDVADQVPDERREDDVQRHQQARGHDRKRKPERVRRDRSNCGQRDHDDVRHNRGPEPRQRKQDPGDTQRASSPMIGLARRARRLKHRKRGA